ncbi:DUF4153 domain-containing protein [Saccharospirillum impatiens]|uniref:DUF4153 domain-containing protein n=1 Tax=Saccharospirillum impatiens TaxID=169438 RepID=UPI0004264F9C|nr:DUF4173 domain-containing protein [Saccharospirillum impatiens]
MDTTYTSETLPLKRTALMWALALGVLGDLLLQAGPIGPGLVAWVGLGGAALVWLAWQGNPAHWRAITAWSAVALTAAGLMVIRDNGFIQFLLFLLLPFSVSQIIMLGWGARLGRSLPLDHLYALVSVPVRALLGAVPLLTGTTRPGGHKLHRLASIGRGLALALPLLWVFTGLLSSADAGFSRIASQALSHFSIPGLTRHLITALLLAWVFSGWLASVTDPATENRFRRIPLPRIGRDETLIVLGSLTLLFGGFVALQLGYLFGGQAVIQRVSGLTMADYARQGFFELVVIAGLTLSVLLFAGAVTASQRLYRKLALVLVGLVLVMLVSATQRFVVYIDAFGLSLDRLTVLAILLWLALTLVFFSATVLRGKLNWFASGATLAGVIMVLGFALFNPAGWVASVNLDRAIHHQQSLDTDYLISLGADAVPVVLERLDALPGQARCELAASLLWRWPPAVGYQRDWRAWNRSEAVAAERVSEQGSILRVLARGCLVER